MLIQNGELVAVALREQFTEPSGSSGAVDTKKTGWSDIHRGQRSVDPGVGFRHGCIIAFHLRCARYCDPTVSAPPVASWPS